MTWKPAVARRAARSSHTLRWRLAVALVEQKDAGTAFSGREIRAFEAGTVGRGEVRDPWRRRFLGPGWEAKQKRHQQHRGEEKGRETAADHRASVLMCTLGRVKGQFLSS